MQDQLRALELDVAESISSDSFDHAGRSIARYVGVVEECARAENTSCGLSRLQARANRFLEDMGLLVAAARDVRSSELDRLRVRALYEPPPERDHSGSITSTA